MDYKNKYLKYKNKYLQLKQMIGGVNKQTPFLLYIIGEETGKLSQRSYLCTFLHEIEFIKKYTGITNERIHLIYGKNGREDVLQTCEHPKAGIMADKPIPYGINVTYINDTYDQVLTQQLITQILQKNVEPTTPIIFIYDGHGYTNPTATNGEGEMILYNNLTISVNIFHTIFKSFDSNKKFIIFTQCGSFGFYTNLISLPNKLTNCVYLLSTNSLGQCGLGARVLVKYSELINQNPNKYLFFNDMKTDIGTYHLEDLTPIKISDILPIYQVKQHVTVITGDKVKLNTDNNNYMGYTLPATNRKPVENTTTAGPHNYIWIVETLPNNNIRLKTENEYLNSYSKINEHAYIDIYEPQNNTNIYLWNNKIGEDKQEFIINDDNTISPKYNLNSVIGFDSVKQKFVHNDKKVFDAKNLVKISKI